MYFPIDQVMQACYVNGKLKIKVMFKDKSINWSPITCLNDKARALFYDMQMNITHVPSLRSR